MFPEFDLSQLPFQYLAERDSLPDSRAIYFAVTNIKNSSLKEQLPGLAILEHDPILLLWLQ